MVLHDYECTVCGYEYEAGIDSPASASCPRCKGEVRIAWHRAPALHGVDGPGNQSWGRCFERVDLDAEFQRIGRDLEDRGELKKPETAAWLNMIGNDIKRKPPEKRRYDIFQNGDCL